MEENDDSPIFLVLGPICGYANPLGLPERSCEWMKYTRWTPRISELTVKRFVEEARYFLKIHNVVVQHFVRCLPFKDYFEEGSDRGRKKTKRDSLYNVLWKFDSLDQLVNPEDENPQKAQVEEVDETIDKEVDKSCKSVRKMIASSSSTTDQDNISTCSSLLEFIQAQASTSQAPQDRPSLFKRMSDRFTKVIHDEFTQLKKTLQMIFPDFSDKQENKLYKLIRRTHDYSDLLVLIETGIPAVRWPAYNGGVMEYVDLREDYEGKGVYHVLYAPSLLIAQLESVYITAYNLFRKTYALEKKLEALSCDEFRSLQEAKQRIVFPAVQDFPGESHGASSSQ